MIRKRNYEVRLKDGWSLDSCYGRPLHSDGSRHGEMLYTKTLYDYVESGFIGIRNHNLLGKLQPKAKTQKNRKSNKKSWTQHRTVSGNSGNSWWCQASGADTVPDSFQELKTPTVSIWKRSRFATQNIKPSDARWDFWRWARPYLPTVRCLMNFFKKVQLIITI